MARLFKIATALAMVSTVVLGCGGTDEPTDTSSDTLRIVVPAEPNSLNSVVDNNARSIGITKLIVERLVASDESGIPVEGGLIDSWERSSSDEREWTMQVRDGVTFTNDEAFNAEAAAFAITTMRDSDSSFSSYVQVIDEVEAVDDTTLRITTTDPIGFVPELLTLVQAVPPDYYGSMEEADFGREPIGTGPFVLEEWLTGQRINLVRNEDYWSTAPQLQSVVVSFSPEADTRISLLKTGDADLVSNVPPISVEDIESTGDLSVMSIPTTSVMTLQMNKAAAPMDDVRVRRAIAHAIDRESLVGTVFGGVGATVYQDLFAPSFGQHELTDVPEFDVDAAQALLQEVGDVPPIEFNYPTGRYLLDDQVGQAIVGMLENAGFTVNSHPMEFGAFLDLLLAGNVPGLFMIGNQSQYHHQSYNLNSYFLPTSVISYCSDPEIADQAASALSLTGEESDAAYRDIAEKLVVEEACPVSLYLQNESWGASGDVEGFAPRADEALNLIDVTVGG